MRKRKLIISLLLLTVGLLAIGVLLITTYRSKSHSTSALTPVLIHTSEKNIPLLVEIADSGSQMQKGLMFRETLDEGQGMLFVFPDEAIRTFWMKNTLIPLDIIFIDKSGKIVSISENTLPNQTETVYKSASLAQFVLEVNAGWCEQNDIRVGNELSEVNNSELIYLEADKSHESK